VKTPAAVVADIQSRLSNKWHLHLAGTADAFPHAFPLGRPTSTDLRADYASAHARTVDWQDWARGHRVELIYENRVAKGGSRQVLPTHARIESVDQAATIVDGDWPDRLARGRERLQVLSERHPQVRDVDKLLRLLDKYSTVDFELVLTVADWFLEDPTRAAGLTPRQVPIPGVHAKWLQNHRAGVLALTGLDDFGLLPPHPPRIHFTYLDPAYRATSKRIHDSATVGDAFAPAYLPEVVVISENKDTAIHFPTVPGGISVEGVGTGGKTPAALPWVRDAPVVIYWGDIDRDGYEILNGYRADFDRDIDSILMNAVTYEAYRDFGTNLDKHGRPLTAGEPKPVIRLRAAEREMYLRVLAADHAGHRRLEQERIPLDVALDAVELARATAASRPS